MSTPNTRHNGGSQGVSLLRGQRVSPLNTLLHGKHPRKVRGRVKGGGDDPRTLAKGKWMNVSKEKSLNRGTS